MRDESGQSVGLRRARVTDTAPLEALAIAFEAKDPMPRSITNLYRRAGWTDRGSLLMSRRIA